MYSNQIFTPYRLPGGLALSNRLVKAAMEENLATEEFIPGTALWNLYETWANGGVGLIITGNVMIDGRALTGPGGVVFESDLFLEDFRTWAKKSKSNGTKVIMQINHPGRQVLSKMGGNVWAPSAVPLNMGGFSKMFGQPKEMTSPEIEETIQKFSNTAVLAEAAGFDGVEIHAAHGYLISQFLSPLSNRRTDRYGGSLENRTSFLLEVVTEVRKKVKPEFAVSVKLNSADFQKGGFDIEDAKKVISMLADTRGVDFVELSGGSYEAPAMQGDSRDGRTLAREAYFLEFAKEITKTSAIPIMITGGIKRKEVAEEVITNGVSLVGIATALALNPDLPNDWKNQNTYVRDLPIVGWKSKPLVALANMAMVKYQLNRMSKKKKPSLKISPLFTVIKDQLKTNLRIKKYHIWLKKHYTS
ncbi:NADH:flavin oxidoreductase/NADH oxidase family protein [Leptospira ilyithenensis]|uniref:NADH:flavin oxidoreductase/NADH oxidase family protein n=1 Tax=Leptospira ilyithenensis TaxID=2484901 RepID=A0A4R9LX49_9LEPT|nr:NADH:flavin oxidoreductase/NADH oxidase family protein [Leptospira ilyithenensis]TGN16746.1 NADH:flavin oxidoreductase/NADH oxidase family protein [Leptospira ilyithenensis]